MSETDNKKKTPQTPIKETLTNPKRKQLLNHTGITSNSDPKVITILAPNMIHQIQRTSEPSFHLNELILPMRRVPSKREHILNPVGSNRLERVVDLLHRHVGAGQMHHRLHADRVLHPRGDLEGEIGGGSSGAPGDVAEGWAVRDQTIHPFEEILDAIFGLRREELEGEGGLALLRRGFDLVDYLHRCR